MNFTADLWIWEGEAAWYFVTLPETLSDEVAESAPSARGFGSVRVEVTVGSTTWRTSLFPDKKAGAYVLPVKKAVRTAEGLAAGDRLSIALEVLA